MERKPAPVSLLPGMPWDAPRSSPGHSRDPSANGGKSLGILLDFFGIPAPGAPSPRRDPGYTAGPKSFKNQRKTIDFGAPGPGMPRNYFRNYPELSPAGRGHGPRLEPHKPCARFSDYGRRTNSLTCYSCNPLCSGALPIEYEQARSLTHEIVV